MGYNFKQCERDQQYLMPPSLREWLPEGDLVWFILDAVEQMDLSGFYAAYREDGKGQTAYDPSMMVSLLLYTYCNGERSSRRIERLCERDIAYKVITADQVPDHTTISRFRKQHEHEIEGLFIEVLRLCAQAGLVKVGTVALDGTKVKANAALSANRTEKHIEEEVKRMLQEAAAKDAEEDKKYGKERRGDELPEELRDRGSRLARLKECKAQLEKEREEAKKKQQEKIEQREAEEKASGKKKRGRKPKTPEETAQKKEEAKANVTDPESGIMKTRKGYEQGYNAQAVVTENQIVLAADVTQEPNDVKQLHPMMEKAEENRKAVGIEDRVETGLADAGYCSEENLSKEDPEGPALLVATKKDWKQQKAMREEPSPRGRIPKDLTAKERMERKLRTKRGRQIYKKRSYTVEPVFGQIKDVRGFDRFMRRGVCACRSEWLLICGTHNLLKLWRSDVVVSRN
jgi:transposase